MGMITFRNIERTEELVVNYVKADISPRSIYIFVSHCIVFSFFVFYVS